MPCCANFAMILIEIAVLLVCLYCTLLLSVITMLNYILFFAMLFGLFKIWKVLEKIRKKINVKYRTKDFNKFMKKENDTCYSKLDYPIKLQWEKEGRWIELILEPNQLPIEEGEDNEDYKYTFEQMIADRRELMFK